MNVGQTVYLLRVGNNARRRHPDDLIVEATVTSVRRKYFGVTIGYGQDIDFCIDDWTQKPTEYISDWRAFESRQEITDEQESVELARHLSNLHSLDWRRLSLEQLRGIKATLEEPR